MEQEIKVRENKLRRAADRRGWRMSKSRSRDAKALDFGLYALIDVQSGGTIHPMLANRWTHSLTLDEVEAYLSE